MNECKHTYTRRQGIGERLCESCGATLPCTHERVLSIGGPTPVGGVATRLRQCAECRLIGVRNDTDITWMDVALNASE